MEWQPDAFGPRDREVERIAAQGEIDGRTLLGSAIQFSRELRAVGLSPDLRGVIDFARGLTLIKIGDREQVRAAGAALFVHHQDELERYNAVFDQFWRRREEAELPDAGVGGQTDSTETPEEERPEPAQGASDEQREQPANDPSASTEAAMTEDEEAPEEVEEEPLPSQTWSAVEALRHKEFERMTAAELRDAEAMIDRLIPRLEQRRTRRWELHPHGSVLAPRPMLRRSLSTGGELSTWLWRRPRLRPRPVAILCDISGSMELYARVMLRFAQALSRADRRTETFVFGTRLTRITHQLRQRDADEALQRVAAEVVDWSGGTRIGEAFRQFNLRWAGRIFSTSGVVIVVSDGWDRGDPALVASETARLRRSCHRLIWLNPLAGAAGYQPLAAGMAAAMPYIDHFLPVGTLASLQQLGDVLGSLDHRSSRRDVNESDRAAKAIGSTPGSGRSAA